ncbi:hypothetical protein ACSQ67_016724 [Phaseolus vulgaris]
MVSHRAHTHPSARFNNTRSYARAMTLDRRQPFIQSGAGGECEGKRAHEAEHGSYQWGEGGGMVQVVKESFIMEGVDFIRVRYLGGRVCALVGGIGWDDSKTLKNNKETMGALFESIIPWEESFAVDEKVVWVRCGGLPLSMWNRGCFERVAAQVGSLVEVDGSTPEFEDLEFARLRINDILSPIVLEEEIPSLNTCGCCSHGSRGEARGGDSDEGSEEKFGEDVLESEGSDVDAHEYEGRKDVEECSAKFPRRTRWGKGWRQVQKEDGTSKRLSTASRSANAFDLIVNGLDKAQLHEGTRNTKSWVDDAVEAVASKSYDEKSDDNPGDGSNRSSSGVESSGEDVVGKVKITEEDDGMGLYMPRTRRPNAYASRLRPAHLFRRITSAPGLERRRLKHVQ